MKFFPLNDYVIVTKLEESGETGSVDLARVRVVARTEVVWSRTGIEIGHTILVPWSKVLKIDDRHFAINEKDIVSVITGYT